MPYHALHMPEPLIVDTHVHVASTDTTRYPVAQTSGAEEHWIFDRPLPAEDLLARMDAAGVAKAVLVQPGPMLTDNRYVIDSAQQYPDRFATVCVVDEFAPDAAQQIRYWIEERGGSGIRLSVVSRADASEWLTDRALDPVWDTVEQLGITVAVHVRWNGLADLRTVLGRRPNVKVALDHLAHADLAAGPPYQAAQPLFELAECPNLYLKVTTWSLAALAEQPTGPAPFIERLVQAYGANRLTWGSNAPRTPGDYVTFAGLARSAVETLSDDDAAWLLGKTAFSLYPKLQT